MVKERAAPAGPATKKTAVAKKPVAEPEPETASKPQLELLGLEGNQAAASANVLNDQAGVPFAALAPKDYFAQAALQQVQKQRQMQRLRESDPLCFELVAEQGMAELDFELDPLSPLCAVH